MDPVGLENEGEDYYLDESSGSAYEVSEDEQSHDEEAEELSISRAGSVRGRSKSEAGRQSRKGGKETPNRDVSEHAVQWASSFQAPELEEIKTPGRLFRGGKKRKAPKPATETRVKRLKSFYSNEYRELLNYEIQDAASRVADSDRLKESQIGSSIWTATEKGLLFTALESLGKDDLRGIAEQFGTKSQHQVQEYVNLLREEVMKRKDNYYQLLAPTDYPAAVEISDECCDILERAGDCLAAHQELAEEKVEKAKWGDTWLINEDVALQIEKKRKQEVGEEEMEEVLPAANLLDVSTWIELSDRIFMNAGSPREEDNWQAIAEPGEVLAVRATAFEDFHSLAYNITKRLVSTALFCSMSRLRARGYKKARHAEVNTDDVEAAVNILRLKPDSHEFWIGVPKRCSLQVVDDESDEPVEMTYKEVEKALRERHPRNRSRSMSRARSQSRVRNEQPKPFTAIPEQSQNMDSESKSESEYLSLSDTDEEFMSSPPYPESSTSDPDSHPGSHHQTIPPTANQTRETAQDAHTEAHDMYTSQTAEIRLWDLLKQVPPFDFTLSPVEEKAPKPVKDELAERENWRDYVEYVGEWEVMDTPVLMEEFERNERRMERMKRRRAASKLEDMEEHGDEAVGGLGSVGHQGEDEIDDREQGSGSDEVELQDEDELLQVVSPRHYGSGRKLESSLGEGALDLEEEDEGEDEDDDNERTYTGPE